MMMMMMMMMMMSGFLEQVINSPQTGWLAQFAERWSLAGELTLFYPRPVADR